MQPSYTIVVGDAHIGQAPPEWEEHFHRFVEEVCADAGHVVINGDLFEFWFEYGSVIPRRAFKTLSRLRWLRDRGVKLTVFGGNHDRWGGDFWRSEMDADFHRNSAEIRLGTLNAFVAHGDGLIEREVGGKLIHRVTRWRLTERVFRALHPDFGHGLVRRLSSRLADQERTARELEWVADGQREFARQLFERRTDLQLVVLGHTHAPLNESVRDGQRILNPGAWFDGGRYARIDAVDVKLLQYKSL